LMTAMFTGAVVLALYMSDILTVYIFKGCFDSLLLMVVEEKQWQP
jgi:hypothetical protein